MFFIFDLTCRLSTERYRQTAGPLCSYAKGPRIKSQLEDSLIWPNVYVYAVVHAGKPTPHITHSFYMFHIRALTNIYTI